MNVLIEQQVDHGRPLLIFRRYSKSFLELIGDLSRMHLIEVKGSRATGAIRDFSSTQLLSMPRRTIQEKYDTDVIHWAVVDPSGTLEQTLEHCRIRVAFGEAAQGR
jgi:hypothetical protein